MIKERILIIAESLDVEDSSGTKGRVALIRNLNSLGYQLKVYHYTRKEIKIDDIECISIMEDRKSLLFFLSRLERYIRYLLKINLYKPLENLFGFSFTLFNDRNSIIRSLKEINNWEPDLVLTLSKGGSFRPHHAILKLPDWHSKWLAFIHDPYPMHWYPPPYPWFEPGNKRKESFMIEMAKTCYLAGFPSKLLKDWMGHKNSNFASKGIVIPHQLDKTEIPDLDVSSYLNNKNFNIVHAGNLIQGRKPDGLIMGFKMFLSKHPEAKKNSKLLMIGGASYYTKDLIKFKSENEQIILSEGLLPFEVVQNIQAKGSVNVILEANSTLSPFLPGKFPHCVKANRPILYIGPKESETRRLLGEDYRYCSETNNIALIAGLMSELYLKWKTDRKTFNLNRQDLNFYLSKENLGNIMENIFRNNRDSPS